MLFHFGQEEPPQTSKKKRLFYSKKSIKVYTLQDTLRFQFLNQKHAEGNITEQEYAELSLLVEKIEKINVNRLKYITALAQIRNVSVRELMIQLGINQRNG